MRKAILLSVVATATLAAAGVSYACSTVVVGKAVSQTGTVLVGHNEDNGGRIYSAQYYVPPAKHKAGEMIEFEEGMARIPQVEQTLGFYWAQTLDLTGASYSDSFVNDKGIVLVSNNCAQIFPDNDQKLNEGGIGYGIRRLIAERAVSARDAIRVASELLAKYGYHAEGRTYTIADTKEAWQLAIHKGNVWVARRVQDNEITYIPNNFMMNKIDATDKENVICSPGLIENAIAKGRYKPAKEGVYTDFNFREAYQPLTRRAAEYNQSRNMLAWRFITGKTITDPDKFPYSVVPNRKFGVEDVKTILRTHEDSLQVNDGWYHKRGIGICRPTTHESEVFVMNAKPELIRGYRAMALPCETPYVPFYPLAKPDAGTSFLTPIRATVDHFKGVKSHFDLRTDWPVWPFIRYVNVVDFQNTGFKDNVKFLADLEKTLYKDEAKVEQKAAELLAKNRKEAMAYLYRYNHKSFEKAQEAIEKRVKSLSPHKMQIDVSSVEPAKGRLVEIALLSDKTFDATKIDLTKTHAGVSRSAIGKGDIDQMAGVLSSKIVDVNKDGRKDIVLTFDSLDLAKGLPTGVLNDVWLYTYAKNKPVATFAPLFINEVKPTK